MLACHVPNIAPNTSLTMCTRLLTERLAEEQRLKDIEDQEKAEKLRLEREEEERLRQEEEARLQAELDARLVEEDEQNSAAYKEQKAALAREESKALSKEEWSRWRHLRGLENQGVPTS